jgi:hypothetical protein
LTKDQDRPKIQEESKPAKQAKQRNEPNEPFHASEVKRRINCCLSSGSITFPDHTLDRMADHGMDTTDVHNVMRGGSVWESHNEFTKGRWRYCMGTSTFRIVFVFEEGGACLITAIRLESKA